MSPITNPYPYKCQTDHQEIAYKLQPCPLCESMKAGDKICKVTQDIAEILFDAELLSDYR